MARWRRRRATAEPRDAEAGQAADREVTVSPLDEILAPERKRARNRMVLRSIVAELLKEWLHR